MSDLARAVGEALGSRVTALEPVAGGDVNEGHRATLADGTEVFVKSHADPPPGFYASEARGLAWLAEARAVGVPEVLAVREGGDGPAFLALAWVETRGRGGDFDDQLGTGLAALHAAGARELGADADGYIASLPQPNGALPSWPAFYWRRRLEPLARRAVDEGRLPAEAIDAFGRLADRLGDLCGPPEPPARLHGDLWAGNVLAGPEGEPWLVDPAAHGGHREVDLAMMRLFGGFGPRCFAAYEEAAPLAAGHEERVGLYQLHPLLVHALLFGGHYGSSVMERLSGYVPVHRRTH